jgi:hypothetical protein
VTAKEDTMKGEKSFVYLKTGIGFRIIDIENNKKLLQFVRYPDSKKDVVLSVEIDREELRWIQNEVGKALSRR